MACTASDKSRTSSRIRRTSTTLLPVAREEVRRAGRYGAYRAAVVQASQTGFIVLRQPQNTLWQREADQLHTSRRAFDGKSRTYEHKFWLYSIAAAKNHAAQPTLAESPWNSHSSRSFLRDCVSVDLRSTVRFMAQKYWLGLKSRLGWCGLPCRSKLRITKRRLDVPCEILFFRITHTSFFGKYLLAESTFRGYRVCACKSTSSRLESDCCVTNIEENRRTATPSLPTMQSFLRFL